MKITEPGVRRRAEFYYQQLDALRALRQQVRRELREESKKHKAWKLLCQIPSIGPIRAAVIDGHCANTTPLPHQATAVDPTSVLAWRRTAARITVLWTVSSNDPTSQYRFACLNQNHNHDLKNPFKGAAVVAPVGPGPFQEFYAALLAKEVKPEMAHLTLARKDCCDHVTALEERSELRRPISETTNSLSVSDRVRPSLDFFWRWPSGSGDTRVRERVSAVKLGRMCLGHLVSHATLGPLG